MKNQHFLWKFSKKIANVAKIANFFQISKNSAWKSGRFWKMLQNDEDCAAFEFKSNRCANQSWTVWQILSHILKIWKLKYWKHNCYHVWYSIQDLWCSDFRASTARTASRHFTRKHFTALVFTVCALNNTSSIQYDATNQHRFWHHVRVKSGQLNQIANHTNRLRLLRCKNWVPAVESICLSSKLLSLFK